MLRGTVSKNSTTIINLFLLLLFSFVLALNWAIFVKVSRYSSIQAPESQKEVQNTIKPMVTTSAVFALILTLALLSGIIIGLYNYPLTAGKILTNLPNQYIKLPMYWMILAFIFILAVSALNFGTLHQINASATGEDKIDIVKQLTKISVSIITIIFSGWIIYYSILAVMANTYGMVYLMFELSKKYPSSTLLSEYIKRMINDPMIAKNVVILMSS